MPRESQVAPVDEHSASREATGSRPTEGALRAATWALAALVGAAPLVIGGVRPDHQLVLGFGAVAVFALTAWTRVGHRLRFRWPLWAPALLCLLGILQLVPLPSGLVAALSPRAHEIFTFSLGDLGLYGDSSGHALSVDPPSTLLAVVHQFAFLAVAWAAAELPRGHRRTLELALLGSATLVALVGFTHLASGSERILGFYAPVNGAPLRGFVGTFVNNNTLASFLALGALLGLGHAAEAEDAGRRGRALAAAALCAVGNLLSGSRGGQVALVVGLLAFAALCHVPGPDAQDARRSRTRMLARAGLVAGGVGFGLALLLLPDWQRGGLAAWASENKFAAWPAALEYAGAFPLFGSGRGTFGVTYPMFQSLTMPSQVSHPENILLQHLCEWGVLGAVIGIGGGLVGFVVALRGPGRETLPRHWGLLAALVAVGTGQLVDFGLEAAGLSLPVAAVFGLALARMRRSRGPLRPSRLAWASATGATLLLGLVAWHGPKALAAMPDRAISTVGAAAPVAAEILATARPHVTAHPADAYLALKVAQRLDALRDAEPAQVMRWLNRALYLAPNAGEIRLLAARALARRGHLAQAADEYRAAMEALPWETLRLVREVVARFHTSELLTRAIAPTHVARQGLGNALLAGAPPTLARETIERLRADRPDDPELWALSARACLALDDRACVGAAAARLDELGRPLVSAPFRARLALRAGQPTDARDHLEAVRALGTRDRDFLTAAARLYRELGDLNAGRETLDRLWPLVALDTRQAAAFLAERGALELAVGDPELAAQHYERAWRTRPSSSAARGLEAAARRLGRPERARSVLGAVPDAGAAATPSSDAASLPPDSDPLERLPGTSAPLP